jgi:HK97 family phage major capsid protein
MSTVQERIAALQVTRMKAWQEGKALLESATGRELTGEESQSWQRINTHINDLDVEIRDLFNTERREQEAAQLREGALQLFGEAAVSRQERAQANALRSWIANGCPGDFVVNIEAARKERDLLRAGASPSEIRAVLQTDATSGSLVQPTTLDRRLWEYLEASVAALRMPTSRVNTTTGEPMLLPTLTTHGIGTQVATQDTVIGGTDPVFGQVALNAYPYGQLVHVSNSLVRDSAFDLEDWLGRNIARAVGRVTDADLIVGTGTNEPTGMMVLAGAGTNAPIKTGGSLITPTVEKFIDLVYSVNDEARSTGAAGFLVKDSTAGTMRKLRDGAGGTVGAFLWQPSLTQGVQGGQPDQFLGYPVWTDANVAAQGSNAVSVAFGDWSEYALRTVGGVRIESTPFFRFDKDQMSFRGKWEVGGNHTAISHVNTIVQNV